MSASISDEENLDENTRKTNLTKQNFPIILTGTSQ